MECLNKDAIIKRIEDLKNMRQHYDSPFIQHDISLAIDTWEKYMCEYVG